MGLFTWQSRMSRSLYSTNTVNNDTFTSRSTIENCYDTASENTRTNTDRNTVKYVKMNLVRIQAVSTFFCKQLCQGDINCEWNNCNAESTSSNFTKPWHRRKWWSRKATIHLIAFVTKNSYKINSVQNRINSIYNGMVWYGKCRFIQRIVTKVSNAL